MIEVGPLLHAVDQLGPDKAVYLDGSVENLFAGDSASQEATSEALELVDVAGNAETQGLRYSVDHPELRIIMTLVEGVYRIVGRRSAGIEHMSDLRGKRVGTRASTSAAYFLHRMLSTVGLTEADLTVVSMTPPELADALIAREVDAIALWEPEIERAAIALDEDAIEFQDAEVYREIYNLNTTAEALADPVRRKLIITLVRELIRSAEVSRQPMPEDVWRLVADAAGYDIETVATAWPHYRFPGRLVPDLLDVLEEEEQWLAPQVDRAPRSRGELSQLIDSSVMAEATADD